MVHPTNSLLALKDRLEHPIEINIGLSEFGLGKELFSRCHQCLSIRTYATFREDHDALLPDGYKKLFLEDQDGELVDNLCEEQQCTVVDDSAMVSFDVAPRDLRTYHWLRRKEKLKTF